MRNTVVMVTYLLVLIRTSRGGVEKLMMRQCNQTLFHMNVNEHCIPNLTSAMATSGYQEGCPWPAVKRTYEDFMKCMDYCGNLSLCKGWKFEMDSVYLQIHNQFFSMCGARAPLRDPPLTIMFLLVSPGVIFTLFLPLICLPLTTFNREMPSTLGL